MPGCQDVEQPEPALGQRRGQGSADLVSNPGSNAGTDVEENSIHSQSCDSCEKVALSSHLTLYVDSDICPALCLGHRRC
jgi:hypothetical protein